MAGYGMAGGAILGGLGAIMAAGDKVKVPDFTPVDLTKSEAATTAGNLANLPAATQLAGKVNTFNQDQLEKMLAEAIPGYKDIMGAGSKNIQDMLGGKLPEDVISSTLRAGNAKALAGGWGSGGMKTNLQLRDLGLNSLDVTQKGLQSAIAWLSSAKQTSMAPQFDPASQFLTAAQRASIDVNQNQFAWNARMAHEQEAAKPDPMLAAVGSYFQQIGGMAAGASMYSGIQSGNWFGGGGSGASVAGTGSAFH